MCDFSGKLIAWLDRELPEEEAAEVGQHLADCAVCRRRVDAYKQVAADFDALCDEMGKPNSRRLGFRRVPAVAAAAAASAVVALLLTMPRAHKDPPAFSLQKAVVRSPAIVANALPNLAGKIHAVHRARAAATPVRTRNTYTDLPGNLDFHSPYAPVVQIMIPADAVFPPGAFPEGMHFAADLTIAEDGTAERLRLQPRLAGFERRNTQP